MTPLLIVIPTYNRCDLLDRTLRSLSECRIPQNLGGAIVAENGTKSGADLVVKKYADRLPLIYQFTEKPNKSNALNEVLRRTDSEFVIFFDDDVRIHKDTLLNYAKEVGDRSKGFFLCGRVRVDYEEEPPPASILHYFPPCVRGWHFHEEKCRMEVPDGLGANWGAFAIDMKEAGGFDERVGPGSGAIGQDSDMMEKLLKKNIPGYYRPDCAVWHFVPKARCSPEWMLSRAYQKNLGSAIRFGREGFTDRARRILNARVKLMGIHVLLKLFGTRLDSRRKFHYEYRKNSHSGLLEGMKLAKVTQKKFKTRED